MVALLLALSWACREAAPAIRAWKDKRRNGNGHTSPIRGFDLLPEPPERKTLRDANPRSGPHTDELRRDLARLAESPEVVTLRAELNALRDEVAEVRAAINGPEGLHVQVALVRAKGDETHELVQSLPDKLGTRLDAAVQATQTTLTREVFRATRGLKDEMEREVDARIRVVLGRA